MTQTSSGLEPLFKAYYKRRVKVNANENDTKVDFVDETGDKWREYIVLHPQFRRWILIHIGEPKAIVENFSLERIEDLFKKSPWRESTADKITPKSRVEMQAVIQRYTTHSISSTINLPEETKEEVTAQIYMDAWESNLKGITVYRDNCRSGVLVNINKKNSFSYKDAVKRPDELECNLHSVTFNKEQYNIYISLLDDLPYEVFIEKNPKKKYDNNYSDKGVLSKKKSMQYVYSSATISEKYVIVPHLEDQAEMVARLVSTSLRHGTDVKFIVDQLNKLTESKSISSLPKILVRVLSKYLPNELIGEEKCEECGCTGCMVRQEGCLTCNNCGTSKC